MLTDEQIADVEAEMPVMPTAWRERLAGLGLDVAAMDILLEAELDDPAVSYLGLIQESLTDKAFTKMLANWFVNIEIPLRRDDAQSFTSGVTNQGRLHAYREVAQLVQDGKLSSSNAKVLFTKVFTAQQTIQDVVAFAKQHNLIQESDEGAIAKVVEQVIAENPKAAEDVKAGEMKAIGFLVGQVMKLSQGRANPGLAQQLIKKQLGL
jgi:aspartyl-tRNA(Asn)/glutamyl-tRNA(Gln) amidotransferase subunit B